MHPRDLVHGDEPWFGEECARTARKAWLGEEEQKDGGDGYASLRARKGTGDTEGVALPEVLDESIAQIVGWHQIVDDRRADDHARSRSGSCGRV